MNAPDEIHNVSQTQFSIARHYGGCRAFGYFYYYDPKQDSLIREDIFHKRVIAEKAAKRAKVAEDCARLHKMLAGQGDLPW